MCLDKGRHAYYYCKVEMIGEAVGCSVSLQEMMLQKRIVCIVHHQHSSNVLFIVLNTWLIELRTEMIMYEATHKMHPCR